MDAKDTAVSQNTELTKQLAQKEFEIRQKGLEIQSLTSSVQVLKNANQKLGHDNGELQKELDDRITMANTTSGDVVSSLRRQLNEQKKENRELQVQRIRKDTEIRQLRNDKTLALNENRKLKKQLVENTTKGEQIELLLSSSCGRKKQRLSPKIENCENNWWRRLQKGKI